MLLSHLTVFFIQIHLGLCWNFLTQGNKCIDRLSSSIVFVNPMNIWRIRQGNSTRQKSMDWYRHFSTVYLEKPFSSRRQLLKSYLSFTYTQKRKFPSYEFLSSLILMFIFSETISLNPTQSFIITKVPKTPALGLTINPNISFSLVSYYYLPCSHLHTTSPPSNQHLPPFKYLLLLFYSENPNPQSDNWNKEFSFLGTVVWIKLA